MLLAILAASVATAVAGAFAASKTRRAVRRVRRLRREAQREIDKTEAVLRSRDKALREEADRYVVHQIRERLRSVSVNVLRKQTGARVKVAPLEQAGIETVGDLVGVPARELRKIRGIGAHSAHALARAARDFLATARGTPPPLPTADLDTPGASELARDCLVYLDAWRTLGDTPDRMRAALKPVDERIQTEPKSFLAWARRRTQPQRIHALGDELAGLETAAEARAGLSTRMPRDVVAEFAGNYADCCALLEGVFSEIGDQERAVRAPVPGAAPAQAEIARKVEAFALDTAGLRVILRRYQAFGARYMLALERTVLGDEMGLGKTIQALATMMHLHNTWDADAPCHFLVVAPASILGNWMHEIAERTPLVGRLLHGDEFDAVLSRWTAEGGVGVTSFTTLRRNISAFDHHGPQAPALLVADEAHYVKNQKARRTRALIRIADKARRVCFMSGTPLENHPEEFVHLLGSLAPRRARDLDEFLRRPGSVLGGARHFHAEVADVYLRRNQEDVLKELPERIDKQEWVDLGPDERAAYADMVRRGNFMGMRRTVTRDAKLERLADLLEEYRESGIKVLLFSYFLEVLDEVARRFESCGSIRGGVPPQERFELVRRFSEADGYQLLLGQITAAGTGLNLQAAGAVVIMEPQLKPTTEAQAVARAHRMGQTRRVVVHRLLARNCVDERLVELLAKKQDLFERFARESLIKDASEEATASAPARAIIEAERAGLEP